MTVLAFNRRPAAAIREVVPGIFMITERGSGNIRPPVNCYVITGGDGLIVDAGYGNRAAVKAFVRAFRSIEATCRERGDSFRVGRILITHAHPDHFSGLRGLRDALGLSVILTARQAALVADRRSYRRAYDSAGWERELIGRPRLSGPAGRVAGAVMSAGYELIFGTRFLPDPDAIIDERGELPVNGTAWRVFPSPGHSDDHISLYDPAGGVLFAGDNILERIITWLGPPRSDMTAYMASLQAIMALPKLDMVLGAHGPPVTRPVRRIGSILLWRKKRLGDVLAAIRRAGPGGTTARAVVGALYRGPMRKMLGEGWVLLALRRLMEDGSIRREESGGRVVFTAAEGAVTSDAGDLDASRKNHENERGCVT